MADPCGNSGCNTGGTAPDNLTGADSQMMTGEGAPVDPSYVPGENNLKNLRGWILRKLGHPKVRIELTSDQIDDALMEAIRRFVSLAERPEKYWQFQTARGVGVYRLPDDFYTMHDTFYYIPDQIVNMIQTYTSYQMYVNFTGNLDVSYYNILMEHLQLRVNRIGGVPTWDILYDPPRIKIWPTPEWDGRHVVISYVALPRLEEWTPQMDLVGYDWVLRYALALCKVVLGRIRGRYGTNVVVGDMPVGQDADILLGEAKEEIAKLEEDLEGQRSAMPVMLF